MNIKKALLLVGMVIAVVAMAAPAMANAEKLYDAKTERKSTNTSNST